MIRSSLSMAAMFAVGVALLTPADSAAQTAYRYPYNYGYTLGHYPYYYSSLYPPGETSVHYTPRYHAVYYPGLGYSLRYESNGLTTPIWNGYQSFAPAAPAQTPDNTVTLDVRVPDPTAEVWFGDQPTTQKGTLRQFVTPELTRGRRYRYEIKAVWMQNGKKVEQTQTVTLEAGQKLAVDFLPTTALR